MHNTSSTRLNERTVKINFFKNWGGARLQIFKKLGRGAGPPGLYGRYAYARLPAKRPNLEVFLNFRHDNFLTK